jgi:hypothetical protein
METGRRDLVERSPARSAANPGRAPVTTGRAVLMAGDFLWISGLVANSVYRSALRRVADAARPGWKWCLPGCATGQVRICGLAR